MEGESGVNRNIIDQLLSSGIQRDQIGSESGVAPIIIDVLHSSDMVKWKEKGVLLQLSLMNFIPGTSKEIKWKVREWCYSKYH